ncbi:MAG: aminopeptidase [Oscillospiraceae bacterium]|nr:aminopeptidase [Oscillospiraceae bacterium]
MSAEFDNKLAEYAQLLVSVGLNIQKGQELCISSPIDPKCAEFVRMCAQAAYDLGASEVNVDWNDEKLGRMKYLRASDEVFDKFPQWNVDKLMTRAKNGAALLAIAASDPEMLKGVNSDRIMRRTRSSGKALEEYYALEFKNAFAWCVASVPVPSWSKKVFPHLSPKKAEEALWDSIFKAVRVDGSGNAVTLWRDHIDRTARRAEKLNSYAFDSLHYTNSLGTDLVAKLPQNHIWIGGAEKTSGEKEIPFVANIPTEEIFTAPIRNGVNGIVYASMPLCIDGNVIRNFNFVVKDGKIVEAHAEEGEQILKNAISVDEGASYFGELALVQYDSPIRKMGILFYNTLFDENASCHIAFGEAYPCIKDSAGKSKSELIPLGLNDSITHEDFMIGTPDLRIIGTTKSGEKITVFENGNFAF